MPKLCAKMTVRPAVKTATVALVGIVVHKAATAPTVALVPRAVSSVTVTVPLVGIVLHSVTTVRPAATLVHVKTVPPVVSSLHAATVHPVGIVRPSVMTVPLVETVRPSVTTVPHAVSLLTVTAPLVGTAPSVAPWAAMVDQPQP